MKKDKFFIQTSKIFPSSNKCKNSKYKGKMKADKINKLLNIRDILNVKIIALFIIVNIRFLLYII